VVVRPSSWRRHIDLVVDPGTTRSRPAEPQVRFHGPIEIPVLAVWCCCHV
jgi:hypothetical protein